jgi:hypothetical protein
MKNGESRPVERGPHFCSMKITTDVRKYAAEQGIAETDALASGLKEKAIEFADKVPRFTRRRKFM